MRVTMLVPGTCNLQLYEGSVINDTRQDRVVISDGDQFGGLYADPGIHSPGFYVEQLPHP